MDTNAQTKDVTRRLYSTLAFQSMREWAKALHDAHYAMLSAEEALKNLSRSFTEEGVGVVITAIIDEEIEEELA